MHVVVAPDAFKGTLEASEVADAIAAGVRDVLGDGGRVTVAPLADGGEGTLQAMLAAWGVEARTTATEDALGRPCEAAYGVSHDGRRGLVELAQASGLPGVADVTLEPRRADTTGTGRVLATLLDDGVEEVVLCLGGSATTDGGSGILRGLGGRLLDGDGAEVPRGGAGLAEVTRLDLDDLHPRAREVRWSLAVDVTNPLCGERGSAAVFGPQKGADEDDVAALDAALAHLADVVAEEAGRDVRDEPGIGAAGGVPLPLAALLGARCTPGAALVAEATGLHAALTDADLVITGEGCLDASTLDGKVVHAVAQLTPDGVPLVALAGRVELGPDEVVGAGVTAAFATCRPDDDPDEWSVTTPRRLREIAAHVTRLVVAADRPDDGRDDHCAAPPDDRGHRPDDDQER